MKASEAPEKIYVQLPSRNWIGRTWNETPIKEGDNPNWKNATNIEYTRTDAFIEKVEKAMIEWAGTYISKTTGGGVGERKALATDLLNYFKKYMK